jgi:hypothetical protein
MGFELSTPRSIRLNGTCYKFLSAFQLQEYSPPVKAKLKNLSSFCGETLFENVPREYGFRAQPYQSMTP